MQGRTSSGSRGRERPMGRKTRLAGLAAVAAGVLALSPASASANSQVAPTSLTFTSNQAVGTTSSPQTATVTVDCSVIIVGCGVFGLFSPVATVTGDFAQTNTCGTAVISPGSCVFSVTFKPTATGVRIGTLATGVDATGSDPDTVSLTGSGIAAPSAGAGKKCKKAKKHSAKSAKKKCKKKK